MLSILIPVYNYPLAPLIEGLAQSLESCHFNYEVLCLEDGSNKYVEENKMTCLNIPKVVHFIASHNRGRISSRRILAKEANYEWLLFLDADLEMNDQEFINNYANYFCSGYESIYGGCTYDEEKPASNKVLRWQYGRTYEETNASIRNKSPYKYVVSANFLIKKNVFSNLISKVDEEGYGYDILFGALMKTEKTKVIHIDNSAVHKGLDENTEYFEKVKKAVETTYSLYHQNKIEKSGSSLLETYKKLKKFRLSGLLKLIFRLTKEKIKRNLLSTNPNVKLLQFYKLGYLCTISSKHK